ncbi:hypothetical protein AALO_G00160760 [Alosa alosa]|uniref:Uncharacterized protein n=1 Tax=Alosa alosa TaxID=278164 RepID=A0AAV6GB03_9TELE|nr:hypothetical protein AALO_G00160760 [Alosa alosa]
MKCAQMCRDGLEDVGIPQGGPLGRERGKQLISAPPVEQRLPAWVSSYVGTTPPKPHAAPHSLPPSRPLPPPVPGGCLSWGAVQATSPLDSGNALSVAVDMT